MHEPTMDNNPCKPARRLNFNSYAAIFFFVFAVVLYFLIPYQITKPKLMLGRSMTGLQPSLFPRICMIGLAVLSIWYFVNSFAIKEKQTFSLLSKNAWGRIGVTLGMMIVYALIFEELGFVLSSALVTGVMSYYFGNRSLWVFAGVCIAVPIGVYYAFTRLMLISLPEMPFF